MTPEMAGQILWDWNRDHAIAHRVRRAYPVWRSRVWWTGRFPITPVVGICADEYMRHVVRIGPIVIATERCCGCVCGDTWAEADGREPAGGEVTGC